MFHHCISRRDDADHTLARCPAWEEERSSLREAVGNNLTIQAIIGKILEGEETWQSFADYCGHAEEGRGRESPSRATASP